MSQNKLSRIEIWFVFLIAAQIVIACEFEYDADCFEPKMHPDLRSSAPNTREIIAGEDTNEYWLRKGAEFIAKQAQTEPNTKIAKNIILFLGDGMGLTTLAAARNLLGGEEQQLSFEHFPHTGFSKTYSVDRIVPDSASTATAYLCGVKANYGTIGVNAKVARGDCEWQINGEKEEDTHINSIAKWAMDAGKAAGFVTTTRITHASPAGVYAHVADRDWENDTKLKKACKSAYAMTWLDIAQQLIHGEVGSKLKVMLGGGKSYFMDREYYAKGNRQDGRNLIEEFLRQSPKNLYVETKAELFGAKSNESERLLGIFHDTHMDYHLEAIENPAQTQPTLEEMTRKAIEFVRDEPNGYFLFIEGGKIDLGHHGTLARIALDETVEFSKAIGLARNITNADDTLIVVTSDHSHSFTLAGYQPRGSNIFDVAPQVARDSKFYSSLSYANGPGFNAHFDTEKHARRRPEKVLKGTARDVFPATAPLSSETHSGEDVAVFASGPWSHLFTGVYEQNAIPHLMAYAACIGHGLKAC